MEEKKCFYCKKMIDKDALVCPYCNSRTFKNISIRLLIILFLLLFAAIMMISLFSKMKF